MVGPGQPPSAERLAHLPDPAWRAVVAATRVVLNEDERPPPHLRRLRAVPDQRLLRGRSRGDLTDVLVGDPDLWAEVRRRLARTDEGGRALELVERDAPVVMDRDEVVERARTQTARLRERVRSLEAEVDRARSRARELVDERDEARRRADGLAARLETERARTEEEAAGRRRAERDRDDLERRLSEADEVRRGREERLRRRHEAELAPLREELRRRRRESEQQERARTRREREREAARRRAEEEIAAYRASRSGSDGDAARPGRPHRLPPGVAPGSQRAFTAVLASGPRVLIDGYNVSKQHRDDVSLDQQRAWLIAVAERVAGRTAADPTIVFDGAVAVGSGSSGAVRRGVRVVFSRGRSADDEIVAMIAALPPDEPVVVVTDDRELVERVAGHGADVFPTAALISVAG